MPGGYITRDYVTVGEIDGFRDFRTMTRKGLPHTCYRAAKRVIFKAWEAQPALFDFSNRLGLGIVSTHSRLRIEGAR